MTFTDQLEAARAKWQLEQEEADAAKAAYETLAAQAVKDGPDVSEHNGDITWTDLKVVAGFALVRASDGNRLDTYWTGARVAAIRQAGVTFGPYHYGRCAAPNNNERPGRVEAGMAIYFAQNAGWGRGDLPLAYDVETDAGAQTFNGQAPAKAAAHAVEWVKGYSFITGHRPILYTNPFSWGLLAPHLGSGALELFAECPLWLANWGTTNPAVPAPWTSWTFHQHRNDASFAGIADPTVDANHFSGSVSDLKALTIA